MSKRKCWHCGLDPAEGYASVWSLELGERFYCHGDGYSESCYSVTTIPPSTKPKPTTESKGTE